VRHGGPGAVARRRDRQPGKSAARLTARAGRGSQLGAGVILQKRYPMSMPAGPYTAWIMLLGGVPIFIGALLFDDFGTLRHVRREAALGIAYNVLIAFAWAHWAWIKIATAVSVTVFSLSMLIIPVVGSQRNAVSRRAPHLGGIRCAVAGPRLATDGCYSSASGAITIRLAGMRPGSQL